MQLLCVIGYPNYPSYPGYPGYPPGAEGPVGPEGPIGGVGGVGGIGGVGGDGGVGPDGPDGPWPTGSPGPDGPWPGDPDYVPGVKPTRKPSHRGPTKTQQYKIHPFNNDHYSSIAQYYSGDKTDSSYTDYKNIQPVAALHSTKADISLYTNHRQYGSKYDTKPTSSVYGKKENTYNAGEINSLLQIVPISPPSKYDVADHRNTDFVKLSPQSYDHATHIESGQIKNVPKKGFEQLAVHDQGQYQKSVYYPTHNLQQQFFKDPNRSYKLGRQESIFNEGRYNNTVDRGYSNVDSKRISNEPSQLGGPSTVPEKQVNVRLEQSFQANPGLDAIGVQPPSSINVKPFPLPIGPDPQACPCYLVEPNNSTNVATSTTPTSVIGQFGFIPVIFVPYCPGDETDSSKMKVMFPSATPVPYACSACGTQDGKFGIKVLDVNQLGNIDYLKETLSQANLGFLNVPVKTVAERRRNRGRKTE